MSVGHAGVYLRLLAASVAGEDALRRELRQVVEDLTTKERGLVRSWGRALIVEIEAAGYDDTFALTPAAPRPLTHFQHRDGVDVEIAPPFTAFSTRGVRCSSCLAFVDVESARMVHEERCNLKRAVQVLP